jgi:hypothetical protein
LNVVPAVPSSDVPGLRLLNTFEPEQVGIGSSICVTVFLNQNIGSVFAFQFDAEVLLPEVEMNFIAFQSEAEAVIVIVYVPAVA